MTIYKRVGAHIGCLLIAEIDVRLYLAGTSDRLSSYSTLP
jgi:hypothetical protein